MLLARHDFLLGRAEHRIVGITEAGKRRSVADTITLRDDSTIIPGDVESALFAGNDVPVLCDCAQSALLLDGVGVRWSSATRSGTGVWVDTRIASRLLLANGVQEVIDIPRLLLVSPQVAMLPFFTGTTPAKVVSTHCLLRR